MSRKLQYSIITSLVILMMLICASFAFTQKTHDASAVYTEFKPTIIIDPGHGGEDSGAVSESNILEKDINLSISLKLKDFFISNGFSVIMTRDTDTALYDDNTTYVKQKDLKNRVELFNSSNDNIVISIHQNKFTQEKYSGTQVFYSGNNKNSIILAENIRNSVVALLQPDNERECKLSGSEIYVLNNTQVPAIMVECGFLSNYSEAQKLNDEAYQTQIAYCIFLGFLEYYYTNY